MTTGLVFERCDPREREAEIKALFARNGKPEFDAVFERVYRPRAEKGLTSWIGLLGDQAVLHISVTPMRVHSGTHTMAAGVLGDLMVDKSHRDFWAPMSLVRTMLADIRTAGELDFLLTTTVRKAESVFKAGGFKPFGNLRRYVLPAFAPYLALTRMRTGAANLKAVTGRAPDVTTPAAQSEAGNHWRPQSSSDFYSTRFQRNSFEDGTWINVGRKGMPDVLARVLVSRRSAPDEIAVADVLWSEGSTRVADVLLAAAGWARRAGFRKLSLSIVHESRIAQQLSRAGFVARPNQYPLLVHQISKARHAPVEDWFLTSFPFSSW